MEFEKIIAHQLEAINWRTGRSSLDNTMSKLGHFVVSDPLSTDNTAAQEASMEVIENIWNSSAVTTSLLRQTRNVHEHEIAANTQELYEIAKKYVAPVITGFADQLLREAGPRQIIFVARDGLGAFTAANILKNKFNYGNSDPGQLMYVYLSRAVVQNTPAQELKRHLKETGVHDFNDSILLADMGMYGTIMSAVRAMIPKIEPRFLISKAPDIPGYASSPGRRILSSRFRLGDPSIHFLEDTFSGPIASPSHFIVLDRKLVPNTLSIGFPPEEALKKEIALKAIKKYAISLNEPPQQPIVHAIKLLDSLLIQPSSYKHLMASS